MNTRTAWCNLKPTALHNLIVLLLNLILWFIKFHIPFKSLMEHKSTQEKAAAKVTVSNVLTSDAGQQPAAHF